MDENDVERLERFLREDARYPAEAYDFLYRGLDRAAQTKYGEPSTAEPRHVSGAELCLALRDFALDRWGPLARHVLARWNIRCTRDFGEMVFLLVEHQFMGRQESDRIEDFDNVYSFDEAFREYKITLD